MDYYGVNSKCYKTIEPALGKGGEGSVYKIVGMPDCVLKVFLDSKRTETRHRKLLAMIATPLSDLAMQQITWPIDVVYSNNQFVGYVMPLIKNNEDLNVMYSDKYTCTLSEKITIAKNLCAAINAVHNAGHVCGDLNPKNIGVDPHNARITLVDTDSYHITESNGSRVYRCEVGLPEYLPHEIQEKMKNGQTLATAPLPTFTRETDLFALAVHIFALLMNGCHPFACAVNNKINIGPLTANQPSVTAPQPIENICDGFFPFATKRNGITTPLYAPKYEMLPDYIRNLFERAFIKGHSYPKERPDTVEWYQALTTLQNDLVTCKHDKKHMYPKHLKSCPWCELNQVKYPVVQPVTNISQVPVTKPIAQQTVPNSIPSASPKKSDSIMASSGMFWFLTLALTLGTQAVVQILWGDTIVSELFGRSYGSGIESWGTNLAIWAGPWAFVICGLIGSIVYNTCWSASGKTYGYKWYHYVLSIITSFGFSAAWILFIFILTIAILIIALILGIALVIGILSGS